MELQGLVHVKDIKFDSSWVKRKQSEDDDFYLCERCGQVYLLSKSVGAPSPEDVGRAFKMVHWNCVPMD
jgi:hypothetical protein